MKGRTFSFTQSELEAVMSQLSDAARCWGSGITYRSGQLYVPSQFVAEVEAANPNEVRTLPAPDPVGKLRAFLSANPDVRALIDG